MTERRQKRRRNYRQTSQSQSSHRNNRRSIPTAVVRTALAVFREAGELVSFGEYLGGDEMGENRLIELHGNAVSGELPPDIKSIVSRCEAGELYFDNIDMSQALKFGEMTWRRLLRLAEHYERMSENFMPGDIRGPMMAQAAKDMRLVLSDVARDT